MTNYWLDALRAECLPPRSQRQVAKELGVSSAQISLVLSNTYSGDTTRLQQLVEGKYLNRQVDCPVLGEITIDKCRWHQERDFAATNPQRVMLYQSCRSGCTHSHLEQTHQDNRRKSDPKRRQKNEESTEKVIYCQPVIDTNKPRSITNKKREPYPVQQQINRLYKTANGDPELLIALLEKELKALALNYNQLKNGR